MPINLLFCFFLFVLSQFRVLFNSCIYIECQGKELLNETRNERYIPIPVIFFRPPFLLHTNSCICIERDIDYLLLSLKAPGRAEAPSSPAQSKRPRKLKASDL